VQSEESSVQSQNSISGTYREADESKYVEQHGQSYTQVDISLTHSLSHPLLVVKVRLKKLTVIS